VAQSEVNANTVHQNIQGEFQGASGLNQPHNQSSPNPSKPHRLEKADGVFFYRLTAAPVTRVPVMAVMPTVQKSWSSFTNFPRTISGLDG
jgi:hypothetical protein